MSHRSLLIAGLAVLTLLTASCTGSEPETSTTTIAVSELPEFDTWKEWADWRMYEMGIYEDPHLRCNAAAGMNFKVDRGSWTYEGLEDDIKAKEEAAKACLRVIEEKLMTCVRELGWTVEYDKNGNWWPVVSPDRWSSYDRDYFGCREATALEGQPGFLPDELPYLYAALTEAYQCIVNLNFDITPPPPFDEWARTFDDPDTESWDPFQLIEPPRRTSIIAACPEPLE